MCIDDCRATSIHGMDEAVDEGHRHLSPDSEERLTQFSCSCRPWSDVIQPSLNFVPQVLKGIKIGTEGRPLHGSDAILLEEVSCCSCNVGTSVIMLKIVVAATCQMRYGVWSQDLINVPSCCDTISSPWTDVLEDHRADPLCKTNCTPHHHARATLRVSLNNTSFRITFPTASPDSAVEIQ